MYKIESKDMESKTHLVPTRIFVFGSNEKGIHVWRDPQPRIWIARQIICHSYMPVPTNQPGWQIPLDNIRYYVDCFILFAKMHPELEFQVTRVGCGFVGFTDAVMAPLFALAPTNCLFDDKWRLYLPNKEFWGTF